MDGSHTDEVGDLRVTSLGAIDLFLRLFVAFLVAEPALSKVLTYGNSVSFFASLGIPYPAVMVLLAGVVEVAAVVLLVVGRGERIAAAALVPVMLVAIGYAGLDSKNLTVLVGALGILVLGAHRRGYRRIYDLSRG